MDPNEFLFLILPLAALIATLIVVVFYLAKKEDTMRHKEVETLNGAEAGDSHSNENVSYIIMEEGYGEITGIKYDAKRTTDSVRGFGNSPPYPTDFSHSFEYAPLF